MSNRVTLQPTVFQNFGTDDKSYGYRLYDDFGQTYCNTLEEKDLARKPLDFLVRIKDELDEVGNGMIEWATEHGMYIGDDWFDAEDIQKTLDNPN